MDDKGQPCPVVVASRRSKEEVEFYGGAITLYPDRCEIKINGSGGDMLIEEDITFDA